LDLAAVGHIGKSLSWAGSYVSPAGLAGLAGRRAPSAHWTRGRRQL